MLNILVLGGGFAGVWSAASAVRAARESGVPASEVRVMLVSDNDDMVIRPRLYERDPAKMCVSLDRVLGPIGVERVGAMVLGIDTSARTVKALSGEGQTIELPYDRLVLATGSRVLQPNLPGAQFLFDVDTIAAADTLECHLSTLADQPDRDGLFSAVVVGAGFTGLEVATELAGRLPESAGSGSRRARVVLVDRSQNVGQQLGDGPRPRDHRGPRRTRGRGPARRDGRRGHRDPRTAHRRGGHRGLDDRVDRRNVGQSADRRNSGRARPTGPVDRR